MKEDDSDLFGTDELLDKFAVEYGKLPVLWCKHDKDFKNKRARVAGLQRLAAALERRAPGPRYRRMAPAVRRFRSRLHEEVTRACAEAALRGGAAGGSQAAARALLPGWARRAEHYLQLLPSLLAQPQAALSADSAAAQPQPALPSAASGPAAAVAGAAAKQQPLPGADMARMARRVVRGMRREAGRAGALGRAAAARVAERLGEPFLTVHDLWTSMQRQCLHKLRTRVWRSDAGAPLAALEWAVIDLSVIYGGPLLTAVHYQHYRALRGLLAVFHLVQRFGLEPAPAQPPPRAADWLRAAAWYSRDPGRAVASAVVLQRRWHDLRADTRRRLREAWRLCGEDGGPGGRAAPGGPVLALHVAVARRYPHVVTGALPTWADMLQTDLIAPPTSERGPLPGAAADAVSFSLNPDPVDGGVIIIDDETPKGLNEEKTNTRKSAPKAEKAKKTKKPKPKTKDEVVADLVITDSEDNEDLRVQKNAESVKPEPAKGLVEKTKDLVIANFDITDSDEDVLQIDEGRDVCESVLQALQQLDPRHIQTTILFASDEDDAPNDTGKAKTYDVDKPKENKLTVEVKSHPIEEVANAGNKDSNVVPKKQYAGSSETKSDVKLVIGSKDGNESHTHASKMVGKLQSISVDSDDDVLVIDDCKEESNSNVVIDVNLIDASMLEELNKDDENKDDLKQERKVSVSHGAEIFKETGDDASVKDEVKTQINDAVEIISIDDNSNGATNDKVDSNPMLSAMLASLADDLKVHRRIEAIKAKSKDAEQENIRKPKSDVIDEFAANIRNELRDDCASASEDENGFEGGIDPKLLMCPVVLLARVDDPPKPPAPRPRTYHANLSPKLLANKRHIEALSTLSETFFSIKRNAEQLKLCKPCVVELGGRGRVAGAGRAAKRVELPDIEQVRRNNRSMLTAQVAPLAHQKSAGAKGTASLGAERGAGGAPSVEELQQLLDDFAEVGAAPAHAVCKNRNPSAGSSRPAPCACARCRSVALAAPPDSAAAAQLQSRLLRRAAGEARAHQRNRGGTEQKRAAARKKKPEPAVEVRRSPSPYDAERAHQEWVRQKNIAAEKFGVKPRCIRKKPAVGAAPEPATITPLPATGTPLPAIVTPVPAQPTTSRPTPPNAPTKPIFADTAILTLNKSGQHTLNANLQDQNTSHYVINQDGVVSQISQPTQLIGDNTIPPGITVTPFQQAPNNLAYLPLTEDKLIFEAQNQPIFKITPNLFNVNAVADINKKLENLASDQNATPDTTFTPVDQSFSPIITSVQSLAAVKQFTAKTTVDPAGQTAKRSYPALPIVSLMRHQNKQQGYKIVLNKSQLKPLPEPQSLLKTQTTAASSAQPQAKAVSVNTSNALGLHVSQVVSQAKNTILKTPNQTNVLPNHMQVGNSFVLQDTSPSQVLTSQARVCSNMLQTSQASASQAQPSLPVNSVYSGPSLASSLQNAPWVFAPPPPAPLLVGPAASISHTTFEMMMNLNPPQTFNMNPQNTLQVNSVQAGPSPAQALLGSLQAGSQLQLVLTPQQINALQTGEQIAFLQPGTQSPTPQARDASALQVSAVRSAPAKTTGPATDTTHGGLHAASNQPVTALQEKQAALQVSSVQAGRPQANSMQNNGTQMIVPQANIPQIKVPQANDPQVGISQAGTPQVSQVGAPLAACAGPATHKRKISQQVYVDDIFNESEWPGLPPPPLVSARRWLAGRGGAAPPVQVVLAAARGAWRVAGCLVLREGAAPPAGPVYALRPLQRLVLPEDEQEDPEAAPSEPKQQRPPAPAAPPAAPAAPRPWLKVKAFAKMTGDGGPREPRDPPAASCVMIDDTMHLKLRDAPLTYAKMLTPVSGLRECCALLLRRAPLRLYSPYSTQLAPLSGELNDKGTAIVLAGPADMSAALRLLAQLLNSDPSPTKSSHIVRITKTQSPPKPSRQDPAGLPKVLNPRSSDEVLIEAVQVAGDTNKQTYTLVLNKLQAGSATRARPPARVVDFNSDHE